MSSNVGGSAGDGGFQFQAKIIAYVAVHILAEATLTDLDQDIEGIPIAVAVETNGPGDDIRIEFTHPEHFVELQAKKGLRVDARFVKAVEKIASGFRQDTTSGVVLAVDPTATGSIRQNLPDDLRRLRQGREDTPHDRALFNRVIQIFAARAKDETETYSMVRRLFVHTFDMEKGDLQSALSLLRTRILIDEKQARAAWNLLVQAGHKLITGRGRYDATSFVRFIQNESDHTIQLHGSLLPVAKSRYQAWLSENTATFRIPGPSGLSLPIDTAWTELRVRSKKEAAARQDAEALLMHYYQGEQLGVRADEDSYSAKDVAEIGHRVVITGGPGAGKSTLCRKLAHDLTDLEEVVMRIDLSTFANRIQNGTTIHAALIDTATNGFNASFDVREALLAQTNCLIADGLDECGNLVVSVAQDLQRWATAHPLTRIVITSRPIGYEITYFPEWEHYNLLPLTEDQVKAASRGIIEASASDATAVEKHVMRFLEQLKTSRLTSLAARNPLLLSFLIQLSLEGEAFAQDRAGLYAQILDLWRVSLPQDRMWQVSHLDVLLAWFSLERIGWVLFFSEKGHIDRTHDKLVQKLSQYLAREKGTQPLQESSTASNCLQFWHERGVLDRFQAGLQEIYTFVHTTFHEYVVGRYLASLSLPETQQWVRNKYDDVRWREPILFAAGCGAMEGIVKTLLEIKAEDEQVPSALFLVAAALAESPTGYDLLIQLVADQFIPLLESSNQALVYEAAEHGVSLIKRTPDVFAPRLQSLFNHPQHWTRLSALFLALEAKEIEIDADELEAFLSLFPTGKLPRRRGAFPPGWDLQNRVIVLGAERLARMHSDVRTKSLLQALYESNGISHGTHEELRRILLDLGCNEFIKERDRREQETLKGGIFDLLFSGKVAEADRKVLETILRLTSSPSIVAKKRSKLRALATLLYALDVSDAPIQDWYVLRKLDDFQAIEAVFSGYIEALSIDKEELAENATWALAQLRKMNQGRMVSKSLLSILPDFPVNTELAKRNSLNVKVADLICALHHPSSIIVHGAAQLLASVGEGREEVAALLLTSNDEQLLRILAWVAGRLWEAEARPLLMKRLDHGFTPESWRLIEELPYLQGEHSDQQFQQTLLSALQAGDPRVAIASVHALQALKISLLKGMAPALQSALLYWREQGERAKASSFYVADDCLACRREPGNAYTHLSQLLDRL